MKWIKPFISILIILISIAYVELTSVKSQFRQFVTNVASQFHADWRQNFLKENPHSKHRFKLTVHGNMYNSSDFIYPMILNIGSCLIHRNLKVARDRYNASLTYVDILNMNYSELPEDWAYENRATAFVACRQVLFGIRQKRLFNRDFIEETADKVHQDWVKRNSQRASKEMLIPYSYLSETEKNKDRKAIIIACRVFNELGMYRYFGKNPIKMTDS